ncbi:MAG: lysophospholipid acyltransferase family protein [Blastocatellia bacterium]|nr:lysophospholipid acyltransferase family protein [Blastocatellia bacterium]
MRLVRLSVRMTAFFLTSASFYAMWLCGKGLTIRSRAGRARWHGFIMTTWGRAIARIMHMRVHLDGRPPALPYFLVSNHLSYVDIIAYAAVTDCVFVSRHDVADWPGIGAMARSVGTVFLNRESLQDIPRVIEMIDELLDDRMGVILFPEGTSTIGDKVLPFSPALLEPAARAGYPVSYASIRYATPAGEPHASLAVCWWGDMTFLPHLVGLLQLREFDVFIHFGAEAIRAEDRKTLARNLWRAVNDQFVPVVEPALRESLRER